MDKALILLFLFLAQTMQMGPIMSPQPVGATGHTFTFLHASQNLSCSPSITCSVTVPSTTAGTLLTYWIIGQSGTNLTIITATGGTFVHCSNCAQADAANLFIDGGYVLAGTGGLTTITFTVSSGLIGYAVEVDEISYTGAGAISLDTSNGNALTTCTSCAVLGVTLTGTSDYLSRMFGVDNTPTAPGAPWTNPANIATSGVIGAVNQSTAATFNIAQSGGGGVAQAIMAFK